MNDVGIMIVAVDPAMPFRRPDGGKVECCKEVAVGKARAKLSNHHPDTLVTGRIFDEPNGGFDVWAESNQVRCDFDLTKRYRAQRCQRSEIAQTEYRTCIGD